EIDRLSREYFYADHMNAIIGVYIELDEVTDLQCDYLKLLQKCECLETELSKSKQMSKSFESVQKHAINLELELQQCKEKLFEIVLFIVDSGCSKHMTGNLKLLINFVEKFLGTVKFRNDQIAPILGYGDLLKGKYVDTKIEKSSVIRQPNAFKSQRPSVLGKPTTFLNSFIRTDFSKSTSVTKNNASNDFSKPVTAQTLPATKKPCLKNTNMLAPGMLASYFGMNLTNIIDCFENFSLPKLFNKRSTNIWTYSESIEDRASR
nr:integrase, catalytic region, zinc finger, CCHC-type, peptidase aspartic, catalytic [Tanacetum cinerariifolium]